MSEVNTKARLLFLEHYLMEHTDENHKVTTEELIGIYQQSGFKANRNTIRDDIAVLQSAEVDVIGERVGNAKGSLVMDAIRSFCFLSIRLDLLYIRHLETSPPGTGSGIISHNSAIFTIQEASFT